MFLIEHGTVADVIVRDTAKSAKSGEEMSYQQTLTGDRHSMC